MDEYLYDFRTSVVKKKRDKGDWSNWEKWNVLYQTLAYEISSSRDVERYGDVRNQVLSYFEDYMSYVGNEVSLDIMNGWWFCFKTLFGINSARKSEETKDFIRNLLKKIVDIYDRENLVDVINKEYKIDKDIIEIFLQYLEVVYTIGNIAPIPKGGNVHADKFDSWEYKLFKSNAVEYKGEKFKEYFCFGEYREEDEWWEYIKGKDEIVNIIAEFMRSRIQLIKNRGKEIINRNKFFLHKI